MLARNSAIILAGIPSCSRDSVFALARRTFASVSSVQLLTDRTQPHFYQSVRTRRRIGAPPVWTVPKYRAWSPPELTPENQSFVENELKREAAELEMSPLRDEPWPKGTWTPNSKRTGLICQKIGVIPQWMNDGKRVMCTLLQILDNHVISYQDPNTWYKLSTTGKRKAFNRHGEHGKLTVGALAADPQEFTAAYRGLFDNAGVMPKKRLASFMITDDAKIQPGTRLYANHFTVGQYVTVTGKSVDWGFQGVVHRWGFRGSGGKSKGVNKSHRHPGATGTKGDRMVMPGKHLPGHMGWEWTHMHGLKIWRINNEHQVLYVMGQAVPGEIGEILLIKDTRVEEKEVVDPPFPTFYPDMDDTINRQELFDENLHQMDAPTIRKTGGAQEERLAMLRKKEVKKQAKAKR